MPSHCVPSRRVVSYSSTRVMEPPVPGETSRATGRNVVNNHEQVRRGKYNSDRSAGQTRRLKGLGRSMARRLARTPLLLVLASLLLLACNRGLPSGSGEYPIRSLSFDGKEYSFYWTSPDGALHEAHGDDFKLVQDDQRSYLEVGHGTPVLHLKPDEGIAVRGRDSGGSFSSWWFPFMLGYALGGNGPWVTVPQSGPPPTTPSYRYPPTDTFGRGDTLHGSEATSRPSPPDYRKVQPAPNAVSGQ